MGVGMVAIYGLSVYINIMYVQLSTSISTVFIPKINKIVAESNDKNRLSEIF